MSKSCTHSDTSQSSSEFTNSSSVERSVSLLKRTSSSFPRGQRHYSSILVNEDSLWCAEYANDILSYLRQIEATRRTIMYKSPQISHRPDLISLIKRIAEEETLSRTTVHLAVYLLDVFMDTYKIIATKLNLVTLVCLLIAAKLEERDQCIPKICVLNSYATEENTYTRNDFKALEQMILGFFKWTLLPPTAATFLDSIAQQTTTYEELLGLQSIDEGFDASATDAREKFVTELCATCSHLVFEFLDISLNDRRLINAKPSRLSAACLAAARKVCDISPIWTERLVLLTDCTFDLIEHYVEALICLRDSLYKKNIDKIKKTPDSGYLSDSESDSNDDDDFTHCPIPFKRQRLSY